MAAFDSTIGNTSTGELDTGETIANLLISKGLVNDTQHRHARRVRSKLAQPKTLLNTMLELDYFTTEQFSEVLRASALEIRLGDLLVELGDLSTKELESTLRLQRDASNQHKKFGEILLEQRFIKEQRLLEVLANHLGYLHIEPEYDSIDKTLLAGLTAAQCEKLGFIPLYRNGERIVLACTDPRNTDLIKYTETLLASRVQGAICSQHALAVAINKFKAATSSKTGNSTADESTVSRLVNDMLQAALAHHASDIHCEPMSDKLRIRLRRDGVLWTWKYYPVDIVPNFIARLKVMSKANIAERRRHQDGKIEYQDPQTRQMIDVRCSFYISIHGEKACLRLLNRKATLLNIDEIGMAPSVLERFKYEALEVPTGVVLITGPTGSGKTTTLYGCVDYLNNDDTCIITAEEPVEYVIDGITQCSLNPKIDMTFAETLRHIVRQDPDVIVLGEIRDKESAEAAIQSALTGHKVLSTFHTEDTIGGLLRLMNMNIETFLISSTVVSVLAQRLLRKVCTHCAQAYRPSPLEVQRIGLHGEDLRLAAFRQGAGCDACQYTGYLGRISVFELLVLDERVKDAILLRKASFDIRRISIESSGLITLLEDGIEKAARGLTTLSEVLRVLPRTDRPRTLGEIRRLCRSN